MAIKSVLLQKAGEKPAAAGHGAIVAVRINIGSRSDDQVERS